MACKLRWSPSRLPRDTGHTGTGSSRGVRWPQPLCGLPTSVLLFIHGVFLPFSLVSDASVSLAYVVSPCVRWDPFPA